MDISEKETRAVFLNFKEMRCLEKKSQMLDVEKAYSISLINLDQKVVQVSYKQFSEKVTRIRSHLSFDDIQQLKRLDQEGRLGLPATTAKLDSNLRIKAASKRLKLLPRSKSAMPRLSTCSSSRGNYSQNVRLLQSASPRVQQTNTGSRKSSAKPRVVITRTPDPDSESNSPVPKSARESRRKSIEFSPMDSSGAPVMLISPSKTHISDNHGDNRSNLKLDLTPTTMRNNFVDETSSRTNFTLSPTGQSMPNESIKSSPRVLLSPADDNEAKHQNKNKRMSLKTSSAMGMRKKSMISVNNASKLLSEGKTRSPFSSHDATNHDRVSKDAKPFRSIRYGKMFGIDEGKLDNSLGGDLYKQMKQGLIMSETAHSLMLEDKIDSFMERMEYYISDVKKAEMEQMERLKETIEMINRNLRGEKPKKPKRNAMQRRLLQQRLNGTGEKAAHDDESWKDVNKCRYLRVPDEMIDLSGVQTLVADQMKLANRLKYGDDGDSEED